MPNSLRQLAPVALFAYCRPNHLEKSLRALQADLLASKTPIYIFCDAPANDRDILNCKEVKRVANSAQGFRSIQIIERPYNFGLAKSIIDGVNFVLEQYEQLIVLEDDLVVSPYFLTYMNDALEVYRSESSVAAIHGYLLPLDGDLPETFFLKGADCWGWATWSRAWNLFNPNGLELLGELKTRNLENEFDLGGSYPYTRMLTNQVDGLNQSWAIRWQASVFLRGMMTLYPGRSLVQNIGNDSSGVHCSATSQFDVALSESPINVVKIPVAESDVALSIVKNYHRKSRWLPRRIFRFLANKWFASS